MTVQSQARSIRNIRSTEETTFAKVGQFLNYTHKVVICSMTLLLALILGVYTPWLVDRLAWHLMIW